MAPEHPGRTPSPEAPDAPDAQPLLADYYELIVEDDGEKTHRHYRQRRRPFLMTMGAIGVLAAFALGYIVGVGPGSAFIFSNPFEHKMPCPAHCPTDPFVKSGMVHFGQNPNDTRWLPFPSEPKDALQHPIYSEDVIDYKQNEIDPEAFNVACPMYMKMMSEGSNAMEWARDRTVLFIGSSHDRNNVNFFCEYVGGKYTSIGGHTGGWCHVDRYNFTVVNWFLYGMIDGEFQWFADFEPRPHVFEGRIPTYMLPMMEQAGVKTPDLIVETSLFWDDNFLQHRAKHYNQSHPSNPLTYNELIWHRSRVHALIAYTRKLYGRDIPIMFRTRHLRRTNDFNAILRIFQLDQSVRAIADELGVKLFLWGSKLEGQTDQFYDNDQHFQKGSVTWLFGDMTLFYLKRAITPGCWKCHQWRD